MLDIMREVGLEPCHSVYFLSIKEKETIATSNFLYITKLSFGYHELVHNSIFLIALGAGLEPATS